MAFRSIGALADQVMRRIRIEADGADLRLVSIGEGKAAAEAAAGTGDGEGGGNTPTERGREEVSRLGVVPGKTVPRDVLGGKVPSRSGHGWTVRKPRLPRRPEA